MEILTYFFLQIFIIFDGLSDWSKKWETIFSVKFPFKDTRKFQTMFWKRARLPLHFT